MKKKNSKAKIIKAIFWSLLSIFLFVLLAVLLQKFLVPKLPQQLQTDITSLGAAAILTLAILSGFAQLTGFSIKDFLHSDSEENRVDKFRNLEGSVVLNSEPSGKIDWTGDIFQGKSTKIVIEHADVIDNQNNVAKKKIDNRIQEIQKNLYSDNELLPYVLTLCLDLSDQLDMEKGYRDWIRKELNGYDEDYEFKKEFNSDEELDVWMKKWSSHRLIKTYIKASMPSESRAGYKISEFPYDDIFVAFPISQIINIVNEGQYEHSVLLQSLGNEHFERFRTFVSKLSPNVNIPSDMRLFYKLSELEQLLTGIRSIVLTFLGDARKKLDELIE